MPKLTFPHIKSVQGIFLILMAVLTLVTSLPLLFSGISLMNRVTYQLGTELLTQRLDTLIAPIDAHYRKLRNIGLEDSLVHRRQIREMAMERFARYRYKESGGVYVIGKDGEVLLSPGPRAGEGADSQSPGDGPAGLHSKMCGQAQGIVEYTRGGRKRLASFTFYEPWQSYIGLGIDKDELFSARNTFIKVNLLVLLAVILFAVLAMLYLKTIIITPLIQLAGFSRQVAAGDHHARLQGSFYLEFKDLKTAVEYMITNLHQKMTETKNQLTIIREREEERRTAEKRLAAEQQRLLVTLRSIGDGVLTTDTGGTITMLNYAGEEITGWKQADAVGLQLEEVFHIINERSGRPCNNPVNKVISTGRIVELANHTVLISRDGTRKNIADSGAPILDQEENIIGVVLVFRDVTEKMRLQEHLRKAEKLESLGVLAGGIAHDFNNILAAVLGNLSLALSQTEENDELFQCLDRAGKAARRARGLTQQLLTFSKGGEPVKEAASLSEVIADTAAFVLPGSNVQCTTRVPADLWLAEIDIDQVSQVIQNIIINSDQAMPRGGRITIQCRNIGTEESRRLSLADQEHVHIEISDNGPGIPPAMLDKIFDPFYTTKEKGNGLGLAICHSIIEKHGGRITVSAPPEGGTTFSVFLPALPRVRLPAPAEREEAQGEERQGGRIMIMDDEEMIRSLAEKILTKQGYEVIPAENGDEALAKYRQAGEENRPIDLVIMDLTIPGGTGGRETIAELLKIDPGARAIVASGYSNDPVMANYREHGFKDIISKPYEIAELIRVVGRALKRADSEEQ